MRRARAWVMRLVGLVRERGRAGAFSAEVESHLQLHIDDLVRSGVPVADARRRALAALGGLTATIERHRDQWLLDVVDRFRVDIRQALRRARTGASALAIVLLALAIGLTTAMFAIADALVLRPVPFKDAARLANVYVRGPNGGYRGVLPVVLRAWRGSSTVEAVGGVTTDMVVLDAPVGPVARASARVTPGLLETLGAKPIRGRLFDPADLAAAAAGPAVISEDLWRVAFASDPQILGRRVPLDLDEVTIVGVLPGGFRFPASNIEIWRPADAEHGSMRLTAYVRWAKGVRETDGLTALTTVAHEADPNTTGQWAVSSPVAGFQSETYYRRAVGLLTGGVALIFIVICANVASLLLGRFTSRAREFRLCWALGASASRLMQRALVESAVLAAVGTAGGVVLAWALVQSARVLLPEAFLTQTLRPLALDGWALGAAALAGAIATLGIGLVPAWLAARGSDGAGWLDHRAASESRGARRLTRALLVGEIALVCPLLFGAALLTQSFANLVATDRGFDPRGLVTMDIQFSGPPEGRQVQLDEVAAAVGRLPGVRQTSWSAGAPMAQSASLRMQDWRADGLDAAVHIDVEENAVTAEFFTMYHVPIVEGRSFTVREEPGAVVLSRRMAAALWPGQSSVGRTFRSGNNLYRVVGVARDVHRTLLDDSRDWPQVYVPFGPRRIATLGIRCESTCPSEAWLRRQLMASGVSGSAYNVQSIDEAVQYDLAQPRATAALGLTFGVIALVTAMGGLFSVLTYAVARRRREFGVRIALGASADVIRQLVARDACEVVGTGAVAGAVLAWMLGRSLATMAYGIAPSDPRVWAAVFGSLVVSGAAALWRPIRTAARVSPAELLREDHS